ncbi:MAG: hypothetical protein QM775_24470 [Pirellulales bacterium]
MRSERRHDIIGNLAAQLEVLRDKRCAVQTLESRIAALEAELGAEYRVAPRVMASWRTLPATAYPGFCGELQRLLADAEAELAWRVETKSWRDAQLDRINGELAEGAANR